MKKLLVLLLISILAIFAFAGCDGIIDDGNGDDGGEGEVEEITVEVEGEVQVNDKTYVKGGNNDITVTFPTPVENAVAYVTTCTGGKDLEGRFSVPSDATMVPLWSDDGLVWTGSATFPDEAGTDCCSSYIMVEAGECVSDVCVYYPVVVDDDPPYAELGVEAEECDGDICETDTACAVTFDTADSPCAGECCDDDCSGVGPWSITIFDADDVVAAECCDLTLCEEPVAFENGEGCPIEWTTDCLEPGEYYVFITLEDKVGNEASIDLTDYTGPTTASEVFYKLTIAEDCAPTLEFAYCDYDPATGDANIQVDGLAGSIILGDTTVCD